MHGICYKRWKSQLAGYWESGLSLAEYCRQNNLNIKTASKWRRRLKPDFVRRSGNPASRVEALRSFQFHRRSFRETAGFRLKRENYILPSNRTSIFRHCNDCWPHWRKSDVAFIRRSQDLLLPHTDQSAQILRRTSRRRSAISRNRSGQRPSLRILQPNL